MNQSNPNQRRADEVLGQSVRQMGGFSLIAKARVKLWKAMLVGVFFAGFVAALTYVAGFNQGVGQQSGAAEPSVVSTTSGGASGVAPAWHDVAVTDFDPPLTGTVIIPISLSATVVNHGDTPEIASFYFLLEYTDPSTNIATPYQLPGCAWENVTYQSKERRAYSCQWIPERATGEKITAWLQIVPGETNIDNNFVQKTISIAPFVGARLYENFEAYPAQGDPTSWVDTKSENSLVVDDSLFKTVPVGGSMTLATMSDTASGGIHSHYVKDDSSRWSNYTVTGSMFFNQVYSGIGVTFYSQFPKAKKYYSLYGSALGAPPGPQGPFFSLQALGSTLSGDTVVEVGALRNTWYRFKVMVASDKVRTTIRAKVWKEGDPEPASWQADAYDQSRNRLSQGTIGVKKGFPRGGKWDKLMVTNNTGVIVPMVDVSQPVSLEVIGITIAKVSATSATIEWRTNKEQALRVAYSVNEITSLPSTTVGSTLVKREGDLYVYQATMSGLKARTRYFYRIYAVPADNFSSVTFYDAEFSYLRMFGTQAEVTDYTRRIAYWWGKVNQHVENGAWKTDADGTSGADLDKLAYCKKFYPATTRVEDSRYETIFDWKEQGNVNSHVGTHMTYRCVDATQRIAYWWGKVNQHVDEKGNWVTDPDGKSGANINKLTYCKKWYPNTVSVKSYLTETIFDWKAAGNRGSYPKNVTSDQCVQGVGLSQGSP